MNEYQEKICFKKIGEVTKSELIYDFFLLLDEPRCLPFALLGCFPSAPACTVHILFGPGEAHPQFDGTCIGPLSQHHTEHHELAFQHLMTASDTELSHFLSFCTVGLFQTCLKMRLRYNNSDVCNDLLAHLYMKWICRHRQIRQVPTSF